MQVLVFSDTHGDLEAVASLRAQALKCDVVIHLGDHATDINALNLPSSIKIYSVRGNCDDPQSAPEERLVEIGGVKWLLAHGHRYHVKQDLLNYYHRGLETQAKIALFGHTHVPYYEEVKGLILHNPGSLVLPAMGSKASYSLISLVDGAINISYKNYSK